MIDNPTIINNRNGTGINDIEELNKESKFYIIKVKLIFQHTNPYRRTKKIKKAKR